MERVHRWDTGSYGKAIRLDNGMLRAPARIARVGVLTYRRDDGTVWRELREPDEVFSADSLKSFDLVPVTNEHPRQTEAPAGVTAANARQYTAGAVGHVERDKLDPNWVAAELLISDTATIEAIENGKVQLSAGYFADRVPAPTGAVYKDPVTGDSEPYDYIQKNIRGNHVAVVAFARAGAGARLMLDSTDAVEVSTQPGATPNESEPMHKITIDGVTYEVTPQVIEAISSERKTYADSLAAMRTESERNLARADAAELQVKALTAKLAEATDPKAIASAVAERTAVETVAIKHGIKCDGLNNDQVRREVISKLDPTIKLDGRSTDYVLAMFDAVQRSGVNPLTQAGADAVKNDSTDKTPKVTNDAASLRANFNAEFFKPSATKRTTSA
jgi:hypothetical protein